MSSTEQITLHSQGLTWNNGSASIFGYTAESTNASTIAFEDGTVTIFSASQALPAFIPCRNPQNLISEETRKMVEVAVHAAIFPVLVLAGVITNIINMTVFARQGLTDRINLCLFSLAGADTGFLVLLMAGKSYTLVGFVDREVGSYWQHFYVNAVLGPYLGFLNISNAMTTVIAVERCICIVAPFKAKTLLKTKYMAVLIISIYVYTLSLCATMNLKNSLVRRENPATDHSPAYVYYVSRLSKFYLRNKALMDALYFDLIAIAVPVISLVVVIISTSITVYKLRAMLSWHRRSNAGEVTSAELREAAVTTMLVIVCVVYVTCMTPSVAFAVVRRMMPDVLPSGRYCNTFKVTAAIVHLLEVVNSSANFYIYLSRGSRFRAMLSQLCPCARQEVTSQKKLNDSDTHSTAQTEGA